MTEKNRYDTSVSGLTTPSDKVRDKPPLLSDNPYQEYDWRKERLYGTNQDHKTVNTHHGAFESGKKAQRDVDIKFYEGRMSPPEINAWLKEKGACVKKDNPLLITCGHAQMTAARYSQTVTCPLIKAGYTRTKPLRMEEK
ncbi:hypothetical protein LCGC14_3082000 [marine sediment metagenome]|uniref:Uncharacterized protein n=1 Tax=marine sediment metagenome TaxID=412755 RepID=A0A0F8X1K7_9ZZZZ